jgi:uncharacterized membrane protein
MLTTMCAKKAAKSGVGKYHRVVFALIISNGLSVLLFVFRVVGARDFRYWYLFWNLLLAWLPLLFAWWLVKRLPRTRWLSTGNIILSLLWLGFLPNSFYLVSDLIHLQSTGEVSLLYDAVLFFSFIFNGYVSGFMSLYLVHRELIKRLERSTAHAIVGAVILLCSFAIYLGRNLRWNTWDVLVNPAGLLFDVSDRLINPIAHPQVVVTTLTFSLLIGTMYAVVWQLVRALRND